MQSPDSRMVQGDSKHQNIMKTTQYAGIDYGLGRSNIDNETGIRFGTIGCNADTLNCEAVQDVWNNGRNLTYEGHIETVKRELRSALSDYFSDTKWNDKPSKLDQAVENCFEVISDDLNDNYESGDDKHRYEKDGYVIETSEPNDLVILKSRFYTHAQFCSPCFPGGGHLENPCSDGPKTYCLGHDWFDDGKAPYPVYDVARPGFPVDPA